MVRQLLDNAAMPLVSALLVGGIIAFGVYRSTGNVAVVYWFTALTLTNVLRLILLPFLRRRLGPEQFHTAGLMYAVGAFCGGLAWGVLALLDNPLSPVGARLIVLITLIGMPAASLLSHAVYQPAFYAFSLPVFGAIFYWTWWLSPDLGVEFSFVALVYFALITRLAVRYNDNLRRSIARDIENERLLHEVGLMNSELQRMAYEDPLTGLSNRRSFQEKASEVLQRLRGNEILALMLIDVDNFKWINDTLGHAAGDEALVTLARRIDANSRLTEIVAQTQMGAARIGGDEFIVLYRLDPDANLNALATRILEAATAPMQFPNRQYQPSISMGIALAPTHADNLKGLLRLADAAMYEAKSRGGSCFVLAEPNKRAPSSTAGKNDTISNGDW